MKDKYENSSGSAKHSIERRGTITVKDAIFANRGMKYNLVFYNGSGSGADVTWWSRDEVYGAGETGYVEAYTIDKGDGATRLNSDTQILMDMETGVFRIELVLPEDFEVQIRRTYHFHGEGTTGEGYWNIVEDENYEESQVPYFMGLVEREFPNSGNGFDDTEDMNDGDYDVYTFTYNLQPTYDEAKWRQDYLDILRVQRQRYAKKWEDILENCTCADSNCIVCRASKRALDDMESWINYLADDGMRVCRALVEGKAPGLLSRIKSDYTQYIVRHVKSGAANTCNIVHQFLYHFYDARATSTIDAIYNRLPSELKQLYTKEHLLELSNAF